MQLSSQTDFIAENYTAEPGFHDGKEVIWIDFAYNVKLIKHLKQKVNARWSATQKKWYVKDSAGHRELFGLEMKFYSNAALCGISDVNRRALTRFVELLKLKAYSQNTIRTKGSGVSGFLLSVVVSVA